MAGVFFQPVGGSRDENVLIWREANELKFADSADEFGLSDVILSDGTHAMAADFNMNGFDIVDPVEIRRSSGFTLGLTSASDNLKIASSSLVELLPTNRTYTAAPTTGMFQWDSVITHNYASPDLESFCRASGTVKTDGASSATGFRCFDADYSYANVPGGIGSVSISSWYGFRHIPDIVADQKTVILTSSYDYYASPVFDGDGFGGLLILVSHYGLYCETDFQSGAQFTSRYGVYFADNVSTLTGGNQYALYIENLGSGSASNTGIRSLMADGKFINHTGVATSYFGGDVEVEAEFWHSDSESTLGFFGRTPVGLPANYTITNDATDRAYDADATNVAELADVLATVIRDLVAYGLLRHT
jgi:hypothetical protein